MGAISRGSKNAFRNVGRTLAVTVILGLSLAMALSMAVAKEAVDGRIKAANANVATVLASVANTLEVRPAGGGGFGGFGGFNPNNLDEGNLTAVASLSHVTGVTAALNVQVPANDTNLQSALTFGGGRRGGQGTQGGTQGGATGTTGTSGTGTQGPRGGGGRNFTPPVFAVGTNDLSNLPSLGTGSITIVQGDAIDAAGSAREAMAGVALAAKNNLAPGSTFTLYGEAVTVKAVFNSTSQNQFAGAALVLPLATLQSLSNETGEVSVAFVRVDTLASMPATQAAVSAQLGEDADVVDLQTQVGSSNALSAANATLDSMSNVSGIAFSSMVGALVAAAVIVFLAMYMVVRERRREIGVLKALGSSSLRVVAQFTSEAVVLTGLSVAVGLVLALLFGNTLTHALVATNLSTGTDGPGGGFGGPGGGGPFAPLGISAASISGSLSLWVALLGLAAALGIAILGSALPAFAISKVRPSEVLRGE